MKRNLMLLLVSPLLAQPLFYVDLSGDWRFNDQDQAAFARPEYDEQSWKTVRLPWVNRPRSSSSGWLRKTLTIPEGVDRAQMVLTLGALREQYAVFVNGRLIGQFGDLETPSEAQISRAKSFPISREAAGDDRKLLVAIHVGRSPGSPTTLQPVDRGPYLLTDQKAAPVDAGQDGLALWQRRFTPTLLMAAAYLLLALPLALGWWTERARTDLLMLVLFLVVSSINAGYDFFLLTPESRPWTYGPFPLVQLCLRSGTYVLLALFLVRASGWQSKWFPIAGAAIWILLPAMVLAGLTGRSGTYRYYQQVQQPLVALVGCAAVGLGWLRSSSARQRTVLAILAIPALQRLAEGVQYAFRVQGFFSFSLSDYVINVSELIVFGMAIAMLITVLWQVALDRRDRFRLQSEMTAARQAQLFLLGQATAVETGGYRIDPVYEPSLEVGGDLFQILARPDGSTMVVVGDVSGKGLRAAMMASLACGAIQRDESASAAALLEGLNRTLAARPGGGFVTCCCVRLDPDGRATVANAGHLAPYWNGEELALQPGLPLGIDGEASFSETVILLRPGDHLTILSDGVVEAENAGRELFGFERTREISGKSAGEIAEVAKVWGQNDDITVVTVRRLT